MNATGFSLFKRNGVYYIVYTDETGTRRQKTTRCRLKADALKVLSNFSTFLIEEQKPKRTALSSFTRDFLAYAESNMSPSTARAYRLALHDFLRIIGDIDIAKITAKHWDQFKTDRLNERTCVRRKYDTPEQAVTAHEKQPLLSPVSVNVSLRHIKAAMSTAARWQLVAKNPFDKLSLVAIPKRAPAFLTAETAELLLLKIEEPWMKDIVIFAINTGMRRGEILSLRWTDVDAESRVARITNREDFTTKTGEERSISLNDAAVSVVTRRKATALGEYVFTCQYGRCLEPTRVTQAFKKAVRAAGLSEKLHLHSTRHSFASLLVGSGTSLFTVSKLLGHSNVKTSEIYSHLLPQHLQNEVDKINIGIIATI